MASVEGQGKQNSIQRTHANLSTTALIFQSTKCTGLPKYKNPTVFKAHLASSGSVDKHGLVEEGPHHLELLWEELHQPQSMPHVHRVSNHLELHL
eukprot:2850835-Lingulodinium_polyedra.AAC.1